MKKNILQIINKITQSWFLSEPLLFSTFCTHDLVSNEKLNVPFRTGKKRIEYSPKIIESLNEDTISELLKIEIFRILLKHPYQRQPIGANKAYLTIASDILLTANFNLNVKLEGVNIIEELAIRLSLLKDSFSHKIKELNNKGDVVYPERIKGFNKIKTNEIQYFLNKNEIENSQEEFIFLKEEDSEHCTILKKNENHSTKIYSYNALKVFWEKIFTNDFIFPKELCFEEWYSKIISVMKFTTENCDEDFMKSKTYSDNSDDEENKNDNKLQNLEKLSELSSLWEEDEKTQQQINNIIDDAEKSSQWGSIGSNIQELIKANRKVEMNYASILRHFNSSIISSKRNLSRTKPNRRFGFDRLGSRYSLSSKLLIAVDISSSITQENLEYFFSVINQFFRYGVEQIDVILFDTTIHGEPIEMKKLFKQIYIEGRGGTDFQPVADFYCSHKEYDGLIYFTDGFGPHPKFNGRGDVKVLWIFTSKHCYDKGIKWTEKLPNNNATFIPLPY